MAFQESGSTRSTPALPENLTGISPVDALRTLDESRRFEAAMAEASCNKQTGGIVSRHIGNLRLPLLTDLGSRYVADPPYECTRRII